MGSRSALARGDAPGESSQAVIIRNLNQAEPFKTKDGSVIRSLLDLTCAPVLHQSLAEASLAPGVATTRHRHALSEEFYYVMEGQALIEIEEESAQIQVGDVVLISPGKAHKIRNNSTGPLRILCACSPPYAHEDTELLENIDN